MRKAGPPIVHPCQNELVGEASTEGRGPGEPGGINGLGILGAVCGERVEPGSAPEGPVLDVTVAVIVGDRQPAPHPELRRDLDEEIPGGCTERPSREASRLGAVAPQDVLEPHQARIADSHSGRVGSARRVAARGGHGLGNDLPAQVGIDEQRNAVPHDGGAEGQADFLAAEFAPPAAGRVGADEIGAFEVAQDRAFDSVRARLGHGVDQAAGETAVANVERRAHDLELLHRLGGERGQPNRPSRRPVAGLAAAEGIIVVGPVDLDAVEPVVLSGEGQAAVGTLGDLGREKGQFGIVAAVHWQPGDGAVRYDLGGSGTGGTEAGSACR